MEDIPPWSDQALTLAPGSRYRHFKGNDYTMLAVARHSETGEELVIYQSEKYPDRIWARPLTMFLENVRRAGYEGPRFTALD